MIGTWDWEADLRMRCPSGDAQMARWWARRVRAAATPSTIRALMTMNSAVDVRAVLAAVRVPTLVLHRRQDPLFRVEEARYLAERIPSARLRLLDGADHLICGDPDQVLDQIETFLRSVPRAADPPLALAAVVAAAGAAQRETLDELVDRGGSARATPDGGRVVLFDGPATAVRCAVGGVRPGVGLGVSIAEVPRDAATVDGPGVNHARRIAALAGAGELWVSAAAGVLLAGSGTRLEEVGAQDDTAGRPLQRVVG